MNPTMAADATCRDNPGHQHRRPKQRPFSKVPQGTPRLLDKGLGSGSHDLKAAKLHFDAAQRLSIADPRLHYAWGLVCLKHSRDDDAIREFRLAARSSPSSYPSAWPVLVRTHAARKDYTSACQALIDWARTVDEPKVDGATTREK